MGCRSFYEVTVPIYSLEEGKQGNGLPDVFFANRFPRKRLPVPES